MNDFLTVAKADIKAGVARLEQLFGQLPPDLQAGAAKEIGVGIADVKTTVETAADAEVAEVAPAQYSPAIAATLNEGLTLLVAKAQSEIADKLTAVEAAQAHVAAATTSATGQ